MTSTPSREVTPVITFGNWFCPCRRRQVFAAAMTSLKTISIAVCCESAPFRAHGPMPDGGEHALDRVGGPQGIPVLGREVEEGEQRGAVLLQAGDGLGVLRPVLLHEGVE